MAWTVKRSGSEIINQRVQWRQELLPRNAIGHTPRTGQQWQHLKKSLKVTSSMLKWMERQQSPISRGDRSTVQQKKSDPFCAFIRLSCVQAAQQLVQLSWSLMKVPMDDQQSLQAAWADLVSKLPGRISHSSQLITSEKPVNLNSAWSDCNDLTEPDKFHVN